MFGGGAKKEKKDDEEDRGDNSGSNKAQRDAAAAAKDGEEVRDTIPWLPCCLAALPPLPPCQQRKTYTDRRPFLFLGRGSPRV